MRVRGRDDIGPRRVDLRVDRERRPGQRPVALHDLAATVDEEEILHADLLEAHPKRIDPEVVEKLGIARRDVARDPLIESELAEQAEGGGETLPAVPPLVVDRVERWEL